MAKELSAPFPYFGGKSAVASLIWERLGDVARYIEPCFGSGAVLLARPGYDPLKHYETVNDKDGFIANVWRSLKYSPEETAEWCDWPVNHIDLIARRKTLLKNEDMLLQNLGNDDTWHDPKMAGYWIWAASCWIGSGLTRPNAIPNLANAKGVHKTSLIMGQIPELEHGRGVHRRNINIHEWFNMLSDRLRNVQVVCGDWSRVCGGDWQDVNGTVGIFFDPPYSDKDRDIAVYSHDCVSMAQDIAAWALPRGDRESYRIIIAGYDGEHARLEAAGWSKQAWKAQGGYGNQGGNDTQGKKNRHREMLWFSPHCQSNLQLKIDL